MSERDSHRSETWGRHSCLPSVEAADKNVCPTLAEQMHHDHQAAERQRYFQIHRVDLRFPDSTYLDHAPWIRPAIDLLGDVDGRDLLDLGCGHGMASVVLARRGAKVTGVDLSGGYVAEARARAGANEVEAAFLQADAQELPFPDESFDRIWGAAILHHLDTARAAKEIRRLLRPGGIAVFCEPWGGNPLLRAARRWVPYPGKERTRDERPLGPEDIKLLQMIFPGLHTQGFQLFGTLGRLLSRQPGTGVLDRLDARLFRWLPWLEKKARYVVLRLPR